MTHKRRFLRLAFLILLIVFFSTACKAIPNKAAVSTGLHAANSNAGQTRQHPVPIGSQISVPGWQIGVTEFLRGDAALKIINDTDWPPPPLAEGTEYALAKVFIRSLSLSEDYQSLGISNLFIAGDRFIAHGDTLDGWPQPEFLYENLYTAETAEGWVDAVVPVDESNLELVLDVTNSSNNRTVRYFELDKGSSLSLTSNLTDLQPNQIGADLANPAATGEQMISKNWSLIVLDIMRGEQANNLLQQNNPNYTAPTQGQEYAVLHIQLKYFNPQDLPTNVGKDNFYPVDKSGFNLETGYLFPPQGEPWLNGIYLPGAEIDAQVPVIIPQDADSVLIAFDPDRYQTNSDDESVKFFLLK